MTDLKLQFVDMLPPAAGKMDTSVLVEILDRLAEEPNQWAVYPWHLVRRDLADRDLTEQDNEVKKHMALVQDWVRRDKEPFSRYQVEVAIRRGVCFIRVLGPDGERTRRRRNRRGAEQ